MDIALLVLEIVGTVAFAVSGALVSVKAKLDMLGVVILGCITAVGGGIIRDLIIGRTPPAIFSRSYMILIAVVVSVAVFIFSYVKRRHFTETRKKIEHINNFFDALGLAAFSVMGTETAFIYGFEDKLLLSVILGVLTGVGGGLVRDVLVNDTPYILKKHVYALVSIFGSLMYYGLRLWLGNSIISITIPVITIVVLRMLAAKYRWSLPRVHIEDDITQNKGE